MILTWFIELISNHSPVLSGGVSAPRSPINVEWGPSLNCEWGSGSALNIEW